MPAVPQNILIVDDDMLYGQDVARQFEAAGFVAIVAQNAGEGQDSCGTNLPLNWVLIDAYRLPKGNFISRYQAPFLESWGIELADWVKKNHPAVKIVGFSNHAPQEIRDWFVQNGNGYLRKADFEDREAFARTLRRVFRMAPPRCFIVHGHDTDARDALQKLLKKRFKLKEVVILDRRVNQGASIIEKLEREATDADVAFVLVTPDDSVLPSEGAGLVYKQSRPNVFIEAGWFQGRLSRLSGRVILLKDRRAYWPSDFEGLVWIDISNGVEKAAREIERELVAIGVIP